MYVFEKFKNQPTTIYNNNACHIIVEHLLNIYSVIHYAVHCQASAHPIQYLFELQLSELFAVTEFTPLKGFLGKFLNVVATFGWTYMDLFVTLVSMGISSMFRQLNDDLDRIRGEVNSFLIIFSPSRFPLPFPLLPTIYVQNLYIHRSHLFYHDIFISAHVRGFLGITTIAIPKIGQFLRDHRQNHFGRDIALLFQQSIFHLHTAVAQFEVKLVAYVVHVQYVC